MSPRPLEEYQVGWVCALHEEMAAARAMLDEEHGTIPSQDTQDRNNYVLGHVHNHNVVIACLPAGVDGTNAASTVIANMMRTFTNLRFRLMVGIGGGIPHLDKGVDIRLGDVVVSQPDKSHGGVVQYDKGKSLEGGRFERKGALNRPPFLLLTALSTLRAQHEMHGSQISVYLTRMIEQHPKMKLNGYIFPGVDHDCLYCAHCQPTSYTSGGPCERCQSGKIRRKERHNTDPVIHYGIIASSNQVVKDSAIRDRLRAEFDAKCVEMEAAGLMDDFPCLVIRGICDYADAHKNDVWRQYAASTAAAYAKELLSVLPPQKGVSLTRTVEPDEKMVKPNNATQDFRLNERVASVRPAVLMRPPDRSKCTHNCRCMCHIPKYYKTPDFLKRFIGALSFKGTCQNGTLSCIEIKYWLPAWLISRNLHFIAGNVICGSPSLVLQIQRRVAWGGDDSILKFSLSGNLDGIKEILRMGRAYLNDVDPNHGRTALHYAVQKNHIDICGILLHAGADPKLEDNSNTSAAQKAWEQILAGRGSSRDIDTLRSLFPEEEDLEEWSFSHLHHVVLGRRPLSIESELKTSLYRSQLNTLDAMGRTPLHWAADRGDALVVRKLLEAGAQVDLKDKFGATPLILAASAANPHIIERLIASGANVQTRTGNDDTCLHLAVRHQGDLRSVEILVREGANVNFKNKWGNTPFSGAAMMNRWQIGEHLIENGADIHNRGMFGDTPLFEAIFHNSHEFLTMLLRQGARCTDINGAGRSILHAAALEADVETVRILSKVDVELPDTDIHNSAGETAWDVFQKRLDPPQDFGGAFTELMDISRARWRLRKTNA